MYIERPKTFKKLVEEIATVNTEEELSKAMWQIDRSYDRDVISWKEHETLYAIAEKLGRQIWNYTTSR